MAHCGYVRSMVAHRPLPGPFLVSVRGSYLELFEIRALFGHHSGQELVLQPVSGDQEVDECALCLHLGFVVGVEVLGVKNQAEIGVVFHLLVADLNEPGR